MVLCSGMRKRRLLIAIVVFIAVYLFIKHLPTDVPSVANRYDSRTGSYQGRYIPEPSIPKQSSLLNQPHLPESNEEDDYDGPIKFERLPISLKTYIYSDSLMKENVVFLLHELKSASDLLAFACGMATKNRNAVHVIVMTKSDTPVDAIMEVNGITQLECPITLHDARPIQNSKSSHKRRILAMKSALDVIHKSLAPKVIVSNAKYIDDPTFFDAVHEKTRSLRIALKMLLPGTSNSMSWITGLDALSLSQIDSVQIDILIDASMSSAGSVINLLQSVRRAQYGGLRVPRITVELPTKDDKFMIHALRKFNWPVNNRDGESKLLFRKRVEHGIDIASIVLHAIESFYPIASSNSHMLVLSPEVELSPNYLHYIMFMLLEYRYSATKSSLHNQLLGISLELPLSNGVSPLYNSDESPQEGFLLSQRPSGNAVLYFGDRWIDFHHFLSKRVSHDPQLSRTVQGQLDSGTPQGTWLQLATEFMTARGLYILYPAFAKDSRFALATVHKTQSNPVESTRDILNEEISFSETGDLLEVEPLQSLIDHLIKMGDNSRGTLPRDVNLPLYSIKGDLTTLVEFQVATTEAANDFSLKLGGCSSLDERNSKLYGSIDYLFCDPG